VGSLYKNIVKEIVAMGRKWSLNQNSTNIQVKSLILVEDKYIANLNKFK
jgi:hypothetical protein